MEIESCAIIPRVRDNNGNVRDSKLFIDLLSLTKGNRSIAKRLYGITKNAAFLNDFKGKLEFDDANEVTLESLIKLNFEGMVPPENIFEEIVKGYPNMNKGPFLDDTKNYNLLIEEAIKFNNESRFNKDYVAILKKNDEGKLYISVERRGTNNTI